MIRGRLYMPILMLFVISSLTGCGENATGVSDSGSDIEFLPYTSPDSLVENLELAFESMYYPEYRDHLLYKGESLVRHEEAIEPFVFYFAGGEDLWGEELPDTMGYSSEVENITRLFSGDPGQGPGGEVVPGVHSIDLALIKNIDWTTLDYPGEVEGDAYPDGTQRCVYQVDMLISLKGTFQDDVTGFVINSQWVFHVVPVQVGGDVEYRLWKWRDLSNLLMTGTEEGSWSAVKMLYN